MEKMRNLLGILIFPIVVGCVSEKKDLPPPNILWVTIEDLSPMLGVYGDSNASTPNLDEFAKRSVRYTNAFATAPVCAPSRSCIITGYYASSLGTQNLRSEVNIPPSIIPYPKYLRQAGYYTSNNVKEDYNFIDTTIWDNSSNTAHWRDRKPGQPFFSIFNLMLTHQSGIFGDDSVYEDRIRPFMEYVTPTSPENIDLPPYYPDTPETRKLWARYYTNTSIVDYQFANILKELEKDKLTENTIVFFFSDHGTGMPRHKRALHDSGMKIPFMIHIPKKYAAQYGFEPGTTSDNLISFLDLAPTLLELAGIKQPVGYQGQPIIGPQMAADRTHLFGASDRVDEGFELARSIRTKKYLYIRNFLPHLPLLQPNWYSDHSEINMALNQIRDNELLTKAQKDMFAPHRAVEELYDVEKDPYQLHNLAADPAFGQTLKENRQTLQQEILKNFDTGFAPEATLFRLSQATSPFDFAHDSSQYPLENILSVCNLVLEPQTGDSEVLEHMDSNEGLLRYWAVIAARVLKKDNPTIRKKLMFMLADPYPTVQIEAAKLLVDWGDQEPSAIIASHMLSEDPILVLFASRSFQQVAKKLDRIPSDARTAYEGLKQQTDSGNLRNQYYALYAYWALTYVFEETSG